MSAQPALSSGRRPQRRSAEVKQAEAQVLDLNAVRAHNLNEQEILRLEAYRWLRDVADMPRTQRPVGFG